MRRWSMPINPSTQGAEAGGSCVRPVWPSHIVRADQTKLDKCSLR